METNTNTAPWSIQLDIDVKVDDRMFEVSALNLKTLAENTYTQISLTEDTLRKQARMIELLSNIVDANRLSIKLCTEYLHKKDSPEHKANMDRFQNLNDVKRIEKLELISLIANF